ncbi:MAG: hypothetical protein ACHP7N_02445 [Caulobacterales bacterium]
MRQALILAALMVPGLACAQTVNTGQGRLDLVGVAPSACLISSPTAAAGANAAFQATGAQQGQITITQLADPQTAQPVAASISIALPIICNTAHHVIVSTANGGLARVGSVSHSQQSVNGFREFLPYQVDAAWAGQDVSGTSQAGATVTINSNDGAAGQLSLVITVPGGGDPLVAGAYNDQVVVELQVAS